MPILPYLTGAAFEPETIGMMSAAFDDVCKTLNLGIEAHGARKVIARRIIELARRGERDPDRLRDSVLREAGVGGR